jgi:hypothetical protein
MHAHDLYTWGYSQVELYSVYLLDTLYFYSANYMFMCMVWMTLHQGIEHIYPLEPETKSNISIGIFVCSICIRIFIWNLILIWCPMLQLDITWRYTNIVRHLECTVSNFPLLYFMTRYIYWVVTLLLLFFKIC